MKALFYCPEEQSKWVKKYFHHTTPLFLKCCNKPLLEYLIDFCVVMGIKDIRVLNNDNATDLEDYFKDGTKWGVNITYSLSKPDDKISSTIRKNSRFIADDDLLVFYGYGFLDYDKDKAYDFIKAIPSFKLTAGDAAMYYLKKEDIKSIAEINESEINGLSFLAMDSVKTFWQLNMDILKGKVGHFVLPGYNNETGVYLGQNVSYPPSVSMKKPFMIGDNVSLKSSVLLDSNVVLGKNIVIDESTTVRDSIIYDETYIGSDLEIINKIVHGNKLIDPESGEYINIVDKFFMSNYRPGITKSLMVRFIHTLISLLLMILYLAPYLVFGFLALLGGLTRNKKKMFVTSEGDERNICILTRKKKNIFGWLFLRFSLDKYPLYGKSFLGKIWLVGNQMLPADLNGRQILESLPDYKPGIISYSEILKSDICDPEYYNHEMYYLNHSNWIMDLGLIVKFLWRRFWT